MVQNYVLSSYALACALLIMRRGSWCFPLSGAPGARVGVGLGRCLARAPVSSGSIVRLSTSTNAGRGAA